MTPDARIDAAPPPPATGGLPHAFAVVRATMVAHLQVLAQYRVNLAVWMCASLLQVLVYMAVWRSVAEASGGSLSGYSAADFAGYFLVLLFVREMTYTWVAWHFPDKVRTGALSPKLLLPAHPLLESFGVISATKLQGILMLVPAGLALGVVFDAAIDASPARVAVMLALMPLAIVVRFIADAILALVSFWLVRIDGIRGLYYLAVLMLSGQFAPVAVYPEQVQQFIRLLPWWWTMGYPVELVTGREQLSSAPLGLAVLVTWLALLLLALRFTWRRGVRRYGAVGA